MLETEQTIENVYFDYGIHLDYNLETWCIMNTFASRTHKVQPMWFLTIKKKKQLIMNCRSDGVVLFQHKPQNFLWKYLERKVKVGSIWSQSDQPISVSIQIAELIIDFASRLEPYWKLVGPSSWARQNLNGSVF